MNKKLKVVLLTVVALALLAIPSLFWYRAHYSMTAAKSFEVGTPSAAQRVLIATQGSAFKDALVAGIIKNLKHRSLYIRVIDVASLPSIQEKDWNAIVILHTWENWRPQADAKVFVASAREPKKLIVVTTSGSGKEKMPDVDAISAASVIEDVPKQTDAVMAKLKSVLPTQATPQ